MTYSFYGGKEGISFIIKASFESVQAMYDAFSQGGQYNEVGYGEFVIISTPDKANFENGCLYRRGFDYDTLPGANRPNRDAVETREIADRTNPSKTMVYNNARIYWNDTYDLIGSTAPYTVVVHQGDFKTEDFDTDAYNYLRNVGAGAEYIGCIAGPEGAAAPIEILAWGEFEQKYAQAAEGDKQTDIILSRTSGKDTDDTKTGYCTLRDVNGNISHSYFSLDLPLDIFEVQAESVSPYGPTIENRNVLPSTGDPDVYYKVNNHYYLYENGEWIERDPWTADPVILGGRIVDYNYTGLIREKQESEGHPFYHSYDIKIPKGIHGQDIHDLGITINSTARVAGHDVDMSNHNYEMYYRTTEYGAAVPSTSTIHTGAIFKTVDGIETNEQAVGDFYYPLRQDNTLYTVGQRVRVSQKPDLVLICSKEGRTAAAAPVNFNNIKKDYHLIDGTVIWTVVDKTSLPFNKMTVYYTDGQHTEHPARLLDSLEMDDDGKIYAKYSDINNRSYIGDNKQIIGIDSTDNLDITKLKVKYNTYKYDNEGNLDVDNEFEYYNGSTMPVVKSTTPIPGRTPVKYPTTDDTGREIQYLTDLNTNDIIDIYILNSNLLVLYSDPEKRKNLTNPYVKEYNGQMYNWDNLGPLTSGNYIFGKFPDLNTLKTEYPYGLGKRQDGTIDPTQEKYLGWLVSIIDTNTGNGVLYHYDYYHTPDPANPGNNWVKVESFAGTKPNNIFTISQGSIAPVSGGSDLVDGGLWFVVSSN